MRLRLALNALRCVQRKDAAHHLVLTRVESLFHYLNGPSKLGVKDIQLRRSTAACVNALKSVSKAFCRPVKSGGAAHGPCCCGRLQANPVHQVN